MMVVVVRMIMMVINKVKTLIHSCKSCFCIKDVIILYITVDVQQIVPVIKGVRMMMVVVMTASILDPLQDSDSRLFMTPKGVMLAWTIIWLSALDLRKK